MQLINSKIVPSAQNIFWDDLPESWRLLTPRKSLILTQPFQPGSPEHETLLKMLAACKLVPEQYHILQIEEQQQVAWHQLRNKLQPEFALILGVSPQTLGISALFRINEPNAFNDCTIIPSLSLSQLIQMQDVRTALWTQGLKPVFAP